MASNVTNILTRCWKLNLTKANFNRWPCYYNQKLRFHKTVVSSGVTGRPINMPSLSPTMTEGTIVKWLKKEGDSIVAGDVLCEIQTDKAVVSMDTEDEGTLAKILISEDAKDIKVGTLIALMVEEGEDYKDVEIPSENFPSVKDDETVVARTSEEQQNDARFGPAVKHLLEEYGLQSSKIAATGPRNTLIKGDVLNYVETNNLKPLPVTTSDPVATPVRAPVTPDPPTVDVAAVAPNKDYVDIEVTNMRRTIAKRLTESKMTIPHCYGSIASRIDGIIKLRKQFKAEDVKVSVNDFIIKAAAIALKKVPEVNSQWTSDGIRQLSDVDISVAVATDSGLITPIVKDASSLGIEEISDKVKELAGRARAGKLQPHEFIGGSFSISNLGMFGISEFSAVINPPQAAILAIGTSELAPSKRIDDETGRMIPETLMTVTLSYDGRIVSEQAAVAFLKCFQENMENPMMNLLDGPRAKENVAALL